MTRRRSTSALLSGVLAVTALAACAQTPPPARLQTVPDEVARTALDTTSCSKPVYPPQALANKIEGTSTIGFLVGPDGKVRDSRIYASSGDPSLDEAARSAIARCTFKPPVHQGKPAPAWIPVAYVWKVD